VPEWTSLLSMGRLCLIEQRRVPPFGYGPSMHRNDLAVESPPTDAEIRRIGRIEEELARVPVNSRRHRQLTVALRVEARAYRKSLDTQQALASRDARAERALEDTTSGQVRK
jgi:hypothetical protein